MAGVLDVFQSDAFSVLSLTDAINRQEYIPGRAGEIINWEERGVATLDVLLEEISGTIRILDPTPRGGPGHTIAKERRTARSLKIPHYEVDDSVYADEVQSVRAFGSESQVQSVQRQVEERLADHVRLRLDPTLEYQRIGAIRGHILNGDGSTLYNLFDFFDMPEPDTITFDLTGDGPSGAIRRRATEVVRYVSDAIKGLGFSGIYAFAGDRFFDDLIASPEVREVYLAQSEAPQLREGMAYRTFNYGGITWENYRGRFNGTPFIDPDEARVFPIGAPGLFRTVYGPADYSDTVNTVGLPRYSRQWPMQNGKGIHLSSQMNALSYCTRPKVLVRGVRGASV
ncbi:MAG: major capsid protein [Betaproteobacteria bacterium]|nr:major capsid protein [Betaproteobacteria bacterium]